MQVSQVRAHLPAGLSFSAAPSGEVRGLSETEGDSWVPYMARCLTPQFATSAHRASSCWCTGLWSQKVYTDHKFPAPPGAALRPGSARLSPTPRADPSLGPGGLRRAAERCWEPRRRLPGSPRRSAAWNCIAALGAGPQLPESPLRSRGLGWRDGAERRRTWGRPAEGGTRKGDSERRGESVFDFKTTPHWR